MSATIQAEQAIPANKPNDRNRVDLPKPFNPNGKAPTPPHRVEPKPINWPLVGARIWYYVFQIITKVGLSCIYGTLIAEGAAQFIDALGTRLDKALPLLSFLQNYEATYRLKLAHPAAFILMLFVWIAWLIALNHWLPYEPLREDDLSEPKRTRDVIATLAVILLVGDSCLFYYSVVNATWGVLTFSASALIGTIVFAAVNVFAVQHSRTLSRKCSVLAKNKGRNL